MVSEPEKPTKVQYPETASEYRFVTAVGARADKLVYLDFVQHGDDSRETALGVTRLVMLPEVAADLLVKLSRMRDEQTSE